MKKTVAVDLDGVLADYTKGWQGLDNIGDPIEGAVEFTKKLSVFADVIVFTCRCTETMGRGVGPEMLKKIVKEWLDKHGFSYADIWIGQGKPIASAYIDDRAIECTPQEREDPAYEYNRSVRLAQTLCGVEQDSGEKYDGAPATTRSDVHVPAGQ